jgi:hypothetical protein
VTEPVHAASASWPSPIVSTTAGGSSPSGIASTAAGASIAPASAAPRVAGRAARDVPPPVPSALVAEPPEPHGRPHAGFRGPVERADDGAWLARLASGPIASVRHNGGGTSLTLRVTFHDGRRAVFKPAQRLPSSNHRAEIAAYHVDRTLGFGRTAPVAGRRISIAYLESELASDAPALERLRSEVSSQGGLVEGAMIAWHSSPLVLADVPTGFRADLRATAHTGPGRTRELAALSDLLVFDFLIDNTDRFSGGNVLASGKKDGPLVFLDNASAFLPGRARAGATLARTLDGVCRFPPATLAALAALTPPTLSTTLGASLARDPLAPVLDPKTLGAIDARVTALLAHVAACRAEHGEAVVLGE